MTGQTLSPEEGGTISSNMITDDAGTRTASDGSYPAQQQTIMSPKEPPTTSALEKNDEVDAAGVAASTALTTQSWERWSEPQNGRKMDSKRIPHQRGRILGTKSATKNEGVMFSPRPTSQQMLKSAAQTVLLQPGSFLGLVNNFYPAVAFYPFGATVGAPTIKQLKLYGALLEGKVKFVVGRCHDGAIPAFDLPIIMDDKKPEDKKIVKAQVVQGPGKPYVNSCLPHITWAYKKWGEEMEKIKEYLGTEMGRSEKVFSQNVSNRFPKVSTVHITVSW